uniref:Uncharacterized protein n=1 Tax=Babesia bovis TaxID=5865 RepID=S6C895_BABBO|nr:hypothetical protein [Babesia bovis]
MIPDVAADTSSFLNEFIDIVAFISGSNTAIIPLNASYTFLAQATLSCVSLSSSTMATRRHAKGFVECLNASITAELNTIFDTRFISAVVTFPLFANDKASLHICIAFLISPL